MTDPLFDPWWTDPVALAELWRYLVAEGVEPEDPADFMESPHRWSAWWHLLQATKACVA